MKNFELVINQRVIDAINYTLTSNNGLSKAILAQNIGIKRAKFSEILNKRMAAGMDVIQNLCINYGISAQWLITGEGEMLRSQRDEQATSDGSAEKIELLRSTIRDKEDIIDALRENQRLLREKVELLETRLAHYEAMDDAAVTS